MLLSCLLKVNRDFRDWTCIFCKVLNRKILASFSGTTVFFLQLLGLGDCGPAGDGQNPDNSRSEHLFIQSILSTPPLNSVNFLNVSKLELLFLMELRLKLITKCKVAME